MSEPGSRSGGRRRAAPLSPEAEAARARARVQARAQDGPTHSGRRRAVAGRRRAEPSPTEDPWTTGDLPVADPEDGTPGGSGHETIDPWLQDAAPASNHAGDRDQPWDPWSTEPESLAPQQTVDDARASHVGTPRGAHRHAASPGTEQADLLGDGAEDIDPWSPVAPEEPSPGATDAVSPGPSEGDRAADAEGPDLRDAPGQDAAGRALDEHPASAPPQPAAPSSAARARGRRRAAPAPTEPPRPSAPVERSGVAPAVSAPPGIGPLAVPAPEADPWPQAGPEDTVAPEVDLAPQPEHEVDPAPRPEADGPPGAPTATEPADAAAPAARTSAPPDGTAPSSATPRSTFRTEIHGLRGIAVLLVVVYHLWLGRVSGGVDVFLFLSAFFLTGAFARRLEQGRPLALRAYWARTFQRLYPPVTIVILGALALAVTVLPVTSWPMIQRHAVASSLYVQNVALALDSVDYYQHDASSASPLQHMWSLSIQGQVFLLWPLLIGLLALLGLRRRPGAVRPVLGIVFALVGAASLTWSVLETSRDQTVAYFDTGARLWEFAAGSLLALALPAVDRALRARRPDAEERPGLRPLRGLLGWLGIGALIACGLVLDVRTAFPGWIALWPLAAAALVIVAGHSGTRWGVDRLLGLRPVQGLGSISYALYLVHWPLLVGWLAWHGADRAGVIDGVVLLAVALVVAWVLTVLVDRPLHRSAWLAARRLRSLAAVAVCLVVLAAGSTVGFSAVTTQVIEGTGSGSATARTPTPGATGSSTVSPSADAEHPGAAWTGSPLTAGGVAPVPRADQSYAPEDLLPQDCSGQFGPAEAVTCRSAPAVGTATATILIAGDSHSAQYSSAVSEAARSRGWTVYYVGKPGCSFSTGSGKPECAAVDTIWPAVLDTLKPDVVVTLGSHSASDGTPEVARADLPAALTLVQDRGIPALVLRDNPRWPVDEYACAFDALRAGGDPEAADAACGAPLTEKLAAQDPTLAFADTDPARRVAVADPSTAVLCPGGRCSPIIGNVYVYRDDDHLTADFSATMAPWLGARIDEVLGAGAPSDG